VAAVSRHHIDRLVDYLPVLTRLAGISGISDRPSGAGLKPSGISIVRRDLIAMRRIIRPQIGVLSTLARKDARGCGWTRNSCDIRTTSPSLVEDFKDVVDSLAEANDSLTSHRTNEVIRVLTIISVIMLPLTLVSGIYGMNVPLPFQEFTESFVSVLGIMVLVASTMLAVFRWRGWI
jgi:magnesium transporter